MSASFISICFWHGKSSPPEFSFHCSTRHSISHGRCASGRREYRDRGASGGSVGRGVGHSLRWCIQFGWCNGMVVFRYPLLVLIISLIPRLSHRLEYFTFRTISWSWNSSPNYFMARALRVRFHHNTHESHVCRAKCRVCGTVISELGQLIRINIGRAWLQRNVDLISVFHCHCPCARTALGCTHSCASKLA